MKYATPELALAGKATGIVLGQPDIVDTPDRFNHPLPYTTDGVEDADDPWS